MSAVIEPLLSGDYSTVTLRAAACKAAGAYFPPNHIGRPAAITHGLKRTKQAAGHYDLEALRKFAGQTDRKTTETYVDQQVIEVGHVLRAPKRVAR